MLKQLVFALHFCLRELVVALQGISEQRKKKHASQCLFQDQTTGLPFCLRRELLVAVLVLLYVSSYYICVLILLYMCPHTTTIYVSSYCYVSSYYYMCTHTTLSSYYYVCPHTTIYVSSYSSASHYARIYLLSKLLVYESLKAVHAALSLQATSACSLKS